ncbi:MAG: hypothetical protein P4M13_03110 [Alphaproteobacteria bacterium]|nr:hypothetical protein [Alphaproteobacteria bacterium]
MATIFSALKWLIAIFVSAFGAKLASRRYQRHMYGAVDEEVAVNWQNRVALLGIVLGLLSFLSRFQISLV